jgi:hypothetical protein
MERVFLKVDSSVAWFAVCQQLTTLLVIAKSIGIPVFSLLAAPRGIADDRRSPPGPLRHRHPHRGNPVEAVRMNPAEILAGYAAEVVEGHRQKGWVDPVGGGSTSAGSTLDCCPECWSADTGVLSVLPNNDLLVRCYRCGAEWSLE